ncbi:MAG: Stf0 family sulfotransferase [Pseudomonadota bacterium]
MPDFNKILAEILVDADKLADSLAQIQVPKAQYAIYMTPRTGSSWLRDLLRSTYCLGWPEEWFNTHLIRAYADSANVNTLRDYARLNRGRGHSKNGVYGVTLSWWDVISLWPDILTNPNSNFFEHFPIDDTHAFALFRKDLAAQAVSIYRLRQTKLFDTVNSTQKNHAEADKNFTYDSVKIHECLQHIVENENQMLRYFDIYNINPHFLYYEDITAADKTKIVEFFCDIICPQSVSEQILNAKSKHKKIGSTKSVSFTERFRFDYSDLLIELEDNRRHIFERAKVFATNQESENEVFIPRVTASITGARKNKALESHSPRLSVIIPVYGGLLSVKKCLESVLKAECDTDHDVIVIYDAGPDKRVETFLDTLSEGQHIRLYKNQQNIGFVKSVNKGFDVSGGTDVVILNADTYVTKRWLDRMHAIAAKDETIGTITPLTNNGEICSFPNFCEANKIPPGMSVPFIDDVASTFGSDSPVDVPTCVGFCTYISRSALDAVGYFNEESFGRGYGEENDFSRRIAKAGYKNIHQQDLFVFHEGAVSFGPEKTALAASALTEVNRLHPDYNTIIYKFIRNDPLNGDRLRILLGCLANSPLPLILLISHGEGGGTSRYVDELQRYFSEKAHFFCLEPARAGWVHLRFPQWASSYDLEFNLETDKSLLIEILLGLGFDKVHINHIRGIEALAKEVVETLKTEVMITLHDYYFLGDSPALIDDNGWYAPERYFEGTEPLGTHFSKVDDLISSASTLIAPSEEAAAIYKKYRPDLNICIHPHIDKEILGEYSGVTVKPKGQHKTICVIGALSKEKGADTLDKMAMLVKEKGLDWKFHLVGYAYRGLSRSMETYGRYTDNSLPSIIKEIDPDLIWFPCRWPETYSYTLSTAMEARRPIISAAIGAFVSRTRNRPYTWLYPHDASIEEQFEKLYAAMSELEANPNDQLPWKNQTKTDSFYKHGAYIPNRTSKDLSFLDNLNSETLRQVIRQRMPIANVPERFIRKTLMRIRLNRHVSQIWFQYIPNKLRGQIRRTLLGN